MRRDVAGGGGGVGLHDLFDSVRRFINFHTSAAAPEHPVGPLGGIGVWISSCLGMGLLGVIFKSPSPSRRLLPPTPVPANGSGRAGEITPIRWRKGEMIGSGGFGQVYLGMNLDTGKLLAVKEL